METVFRGFFSDARVVAVVVLIVAQVLSSIAVAVKLGQFDGARLADWYRRYLVPYLIGAFVAWLLSRFLPLDPLGPYGVWVGEGFYTLAMLTLYWTLVSKLMQTWREIGYAIPEAPPEPAPFKPPA
jgi:ABC-type polysaccharide transport system permease subunit